MIKKAAIALVCAVGLGAGAGTAEALVIGDARYIGSVNDGIPSSAANEVAYINTLLDQAAGSSNATIGTETYNRVGSSLDTSLYPDASVTGAAKDDTSPSNTGISVTGFTYILGKYDADKAGSLVWVVYGLTTVDIPSTYNGKDLSHWSLYKHTGDTPPDVPPGVSTPDGGATLMMLGTALVFIGALRRKMNV